MVLPLLIPAGFMGAAMSAKAVRNMLDGRKPEGQGKQTRNDSVVDRLVTGNKPPVSHWSEQHLERMLKTNSAMQERAHELRVARAS
mmetsp:Transcript_34215/g.63826  ORF Transcript_34215/g.63826 Transcript_34215/m.63826 type:complete len:86 (+) Transcript_34215:98-355(+)